MWGKKYPAIGHAWRRVWHYFRVAPTFDAAVGPYEWFNRTIIVGGADRNKTFSPSHNYALV
jgi:hypothetical protein